jgi:hypothetical protein
MIVGELEGAETGHQVEGAVRPWQRLEVTDAEIRSWTAVGCDLNQFGCGVDACHVRPTCRGQLHEAAGAAATIKHGRPGSDVRGVKDMQVQRGSPALGSLPCL